VTFVLHEDPFTPYDESPSRDLTGFVPMGFRDEMMPVEQLDEFRHRVGTKPLDVKDWLPDDVESAPTIEMKRRLLGERRDEVVAIHPGGEDVAEEAAHLVASFKGATISGTGIDALLQAALLVPDDLTVLQPKTSPDGEEQLLFVAGVVCSPSRWRLATKMGKDMLSVHQPVSRYAQHIGAPVDTLLRRLTVDRPLWRSNWTLEDHPALFQPEPPSTPLVSDPSRLWVRMERETLRRLPRSGGVLFTIRGFQQPLADFVANSDERVRTMRALISRLPDDVARYKSILPYRERVLTWLDQLVG
jgi:hypothetical protein